MLIEITQFWVSNLTTVTSNDGEVKSFEMELNNISCTLLTYIYKSKTKLK
jgi:hypothetical protein